MTSVKAGQTLSRRIAIVDDSPEIIDLLRELLEAAGHEVVAFSGDGHLLSELVSAAPDAVILDLLFRGPTSQLSGWEAMRLIRSHEALRAVPILVCSADLVALRERRAEIEQDPLVSAVEKPFTLAELEDAVQGLIGADRLPHWDDERELVLVADHDGQLVHASSAMLHLLDMDPAELRRSRVADIVAEGPAWTEREWQRYLAERTWAGAVSLRIRSGEVLPATARADIVRGPSATWHISRLRRGAPEEAVGTAALEHSGSGA